MYSPPSAFRNRPTDCEAYISLTNQYTLIILYYTIQFTIKLVQRVSNPYFGIIIRDLDCELHKLQINNNVGYPIF
jgi:hypothetical protein